MPFAAVSDRVKFVSYIFRLLVFKIIHYLSQSVRFEKGIAVLSYFTLSYVYELFHTAQYGINVIKWTFKSIIIFKSSHFFTFQEFRYQIILTEKIQCIVAMMKSSRISG